MRRAIFLKTTVILLVFAVLLKCEGQSVLKVSQAQADAEFANWPKVQQYVQFVGGKSSPVTGLAKNQVQVIEDGVEQPGITLQLDDQPASICMIFDLSASLKVSGKALLAAAQKMIASANPADEFAILSYQGPVYVEEDFTSDAQKLNVALRRADFGGPSDLFDAVSAAVDYMETHVPKYRRVIVIFSDGDDNYSHVKVGDLLRRLRYPESPTVYSLSPALDQNMGLRSPSSNRDLGMRNLLELSQATGGLTFVPEHSDLLGDQAMEILRDIHSRYSLEYTSTHSRRDGKLHKVEIKVAPEANASKVKAYFRQEYYAPSH